MTDWLNTVVKYLREHGLNTREARFVLEDVMDVAESAYYSGTPAGMFADEIAAQLIS